MEKFAKKILKTNIVLLYLITTVFYVTWCLIVGNLYDRYEIEYSGSVANMMTNVEFVLDEIAVPLIEELVFRWFPFMLFFSIFNLISKRSKNINRKKKFEKFGVCIIVLTSSIAFSYGHGGWPNLFLQGVLGIILCMFYLRTYYKRRILGKKCYFQIYPLLSSLLYHVFTNELWYLVDWIYPSYSWEQSQLFLLFHLKIVL